MGRDGTTAELDAVSTEVPILLISGDAHHAWANTLAYTCSACRSATTWCARTSGSTPTRGSASSPAVPPTPPRPTATRWRRRPAWGVVGLVDFEFNGRLQPWVDRWHDGGDLLRIRWATYAAGLDEVIEAGLRTGDPLPRRARATTG